MKKLLVTAAGSLAAAAAFAAPTCNAPEEKWISETYLEAELQSQGYQVDSFKISAGKCYELQGQDKTGKKVVVYLNPETAEVVDGK